MFRPTCLCFSSLITKLQYPAVSRAVDWSNVCCWYVLITYQKSGCFVFDRKTSAPFIVGGTFVLCMVFVLDSWDAWKELKSCINILSRTICAVVIIFLLSSDNQCYPRDRRYGSLFVPLNSTLFRKFRNPELEPTRWAETRRTWSDARLLATDLHNQTSERPETGSVVGVDVQYRCIDLQRAYWTWSRVQTSQVGLWKFSTIWRTIPGFHFTHLITLSLIEYIRNACGEEPIVDDV
jgi:hypothetical protein